MIFRKRSSLEWLQRLDAEVNKLLNADSYREVTLNRIKHLVNAPNEAALIEALAKRVKEGNLHVVYRVISPSSRSTIGTFDSPLDVPEVMIDDSTGDLIEIDRFRNVEPVYVSEVNSAR